MKIHILSSDQFSPYVIKKDINGNLICPYSIYEKEQEKIAQKLGLLIDNNNVYFPLKCFERSENDSLVIGVEDKNIIGFAFSRPFNYYREYCTQNSDNWYLEFVLIDKEYRQNGYGLQLLSVCAEDSKNHGAKTLSAIFLSDGKGKKMFNNYVKLYNKKSLTPIRDYESTIEL